jgi:DNA-binding NarL/FixJ family response regulator
VVLSEIELRVAELAAAGLAVETIAEALGLTPSAAAAQLRAVYRKLGGQRATGQSESP